MKTCNFSVNKVTDVAVSQAPEGTVDMLKLTLSTDNVFSGEHQKKDLLIDKSKAKELLAELKNAYQKMAQMDQE